MTATTSRPLPFIKTLLYGAVGVLLSLALGIVLLELVFRILPTASAMNRVDVSAADPYERFEPNRDITYSIGWNLRNPLQHHVNNDGFVNRFDYDSTQTTPLVAVIGDSYVEALQVGFDESFHGLLANALRPECRVYSFGMSGAPLSQYLAWSRYVSSKFNPARYVINIVGNDFDESHVEYRTYEGYWHFVGEDELEELLVPRTTTALKKILRVSALARYLHSNFQLEARVAQLLESLRAGPADAEVLYVGNTDAGFDARKEQLSRQVVDQFLARMLQVVRVPPADVIFVVDAIRQRIYGSLDEGDYRESYYYLMRNYFIVQARSAGFTVIDLQPVFERDYRLNATRFEFPDDGHWNAHAHQVVFEQLQDRLAGSCG